MREISASLITEAVADMAMDANYNLPDDVLAALQKGYDTEESPIGKAILGHILKNADIARTEKVPICQDTGFSVFFVELGADVHIVGATLKEAISKGVAKGYTEGYLRKSILKNPIRHSENTGDNTPPIVWIDIVPGDKIHIVMAPKGGGSENVSQIGMLKPADGEKGFKRFVIDAMKKAGGNPCPPVIVGVGVGGTFEKCANLAKKALLRKIGERNPDPYYANLEEELLLEINKLGIGPMGLGGSTTALDVHIESYPCHIATFPVAVNINCHAARHKEVTM